MTKERLKSPRARLFVALDLPDRVREEIVAWQGDALGDPVLRAVRPESLHITLVFLGYQRERDIEPIAAAMSWRGPAPLLEFSAEPIGVPARRPRLFALEAPADAALAIKVRAEVAGSLARAGFHKPERRPFWPHVTVAKVRPERRGARQRARVGEAPGPLPAGLREPFNPVRMTLYRSYLRPQGAEYVPVAKLELPE